MITPLPIVLACTIQTPPNIILIMTDDVGVDAFEAYAANPRVGDDPIDTPHIAALAAGGVRYDNAYTLPLCTPTRVSLMTGRHSSRNYRAFGYLDNTEITFAQTLRDAGYATAVVGKWQLSFPDRRVPIEPSGVIAPDVTPRIMREDYGFDRYFLWQLNGVEGLSGRGPRYWAPKIETAGAINTEGEETSQFRTYAQDQYGPDLFVKFLNEFVTESVAADRPFFAYYPMALPHDPFVSTPAAPEHKTGSRNRYFVDMVEYVDHLVGEIVAHLEDPDTDPTTDDSVRGSTVIIFTSDNGTSRRITVTTEHREARGQKGYPNHDGTHVPFIISWPGTLEPGVSARMVDITDVFPTLLALAGANPAESAPGGLPLDGEPIIDAAGTRLDAKDAFYMWYQAKGRGFPIAEFAQSERFKLYADGRLFDILEDPGEQRPVGAFERTDAQRQAASCLADLIESKR